ncbi:hypothetical protein N7456_000900 [Penicillium angulare]|uniref:Uncharacterized protein n=1 Tax=Penicillium angulare TaxID=116970 RepID=A0A9W9KRC4_9EURO|nr:hypothetical protein N7456_000900 [Penicillium angulare]
MTRLLKPPLFVAQQWRLSDYIYTHDVSIKWKSDDFSTASADSRKGRDALSTTAKACIGVGVTFGAFIIMTLTVIYNGKQKPQLFKGITLNAIVSILATASKSSLMFVVGECIAQLRWVSFRESRQSLSYIQLYDSASRGPWGSLIILFKDKCRSLVTIGALIVIFTATFDPFMQQIVDYPVRPTQKQSEAAQVVQSRYLLPSAHKSKALTDAFNGGIWDDSIEPKVSCPTGNCTWPNFRSVEMCTKCVDFDPSNVTLSPWNAISFNSGLGQGQNISFNISILDGAPLDYSVSITREIFQEQPREYTYVMSLPKYIYWVADSLVGPSNDKPMAPAQNGLGHLFGIDDPLMVTASVELNLMEMFSTNTSTFISDLMGNIKVVKVTECALSICAREYAISVQSGDTSVKTLEEDFGRMYKVSSTKLEIDEELCWKPSPSPMTDWNTTGQSELYWHTDNNGMQAQWRSMDLANFEFCGVEPSWYYDEILALAVSALARNMSNTPIYGVVTTQDSYVTVRWQWLTLPAVLLVAGVLLLIATALVSTRGGARLWKSSTLPLMFHGLERDFLAQKTIIENGQCEYVSEMEQLADGINVDLGISSEGRTMLRGAVSFPPTFVRPSRRRSF